MKPLGWLLLASACSAGTATTEEAPIQIVVTADPELDVDWAKLEVAPAGVRRLLAADDRLVIELDPARAPGKLELQTIGSCVDSVELSGKQSGAVLESRLRPFLKATGGDLAQVGFDAPFRITLTPGCREALRGRISWKQIEGPSVELRPEQNGFVLAGKTLPLANTHPETVPWGIVPFSPRTRGQYVFQATWEGDHPVDVKVSVSASARSTGLPSVTVGQVLHLGGKGWRVKERPRDSHAATDATQGLERFRPDARGRWLLEDAEHRELALTAGRHSETPLDCGRSDCHARATDAAKPSPMTTIFERGLSGQLPDYEPSCAIACHTEGEPGLDDGGFVAMLTGLGRTRHLKPGPEAWARLPSPLRRLASVGCTSCHGPGAIPEASASWAILRSDVCATCHDAPPRYAHVIAWKKTRMAGSDLDPTTRAEPCSRCHTTGGFLAARDVRPEKSKQHGDVSLGIACAACHAPHGAHVEGTLIREVKLPASAPKLPDTAKESGVCVSCHAPDPELGRGPSQATLVFGGDKPPHASVKGGCVGCHMRGEPATATGPRGGGHDFRPKPAACASCHAPDRTETLAAGAQPIRERARKLWEEFGQALPRTTPAHARKPKRPDPDGLSKLLLVLEDPAAGAHNAPYARALLDEAERLLRK
jgi:hypothetical protein